MAENGFSKSRIIHQCEPFPNRFINENVSQHVALAKVYNKTLTHFQKVKTLDQPEIIFELYALSFYRSQNVLCRYKFFEPAQKYDWTYYLFKNFCAGTKNNFTECKSSFCLAQNLCDCHNMYVNKFFVWHKKFGPAQNILGPVKRQGITVLIYIMCQILFNGHWVPTLQYCAPSLENVKIMHKR